jgi:RND family efflux transporter MFP subunit
MTFHLFRAVEREAGQTMHTRSDPMPEYFPDLRVRRVSCAKILLALAAFASLAACQRTVEAPAPEVRPVRTQTVGKVDAGGTVSLTGNVQAQNEINLAFRIDGRLVERTVDVGDTVRPGQLIALLDPQNEESNVRTVRAQVAGANARLIEARSNYDRMKDLVTDAAVSRAQYDQAEAALRSAESQLEALNGQLSLAQNRLGYTRLVSDVAGVVTARGPEPGEVVAPGRMVVQVAREGARDAVFDVPGRIMDVAPKNAEITVTLTDDPRVTAAGRVREVAPRADPVTGTFAVRVRLIDPPPAMRLGSTVTGRMRLPAALAIEVPASALVRADGKTAVWVVDPASSTVALRNVELAATNSSTVQVAKGLKPGDVVVIAGAQALRPGQKVRLPEARS